jgi:hypothetical protein
LPPTTQILGYCLNNFVNALAGGEPNGFADALQVGDAALHVFKFLAIGFLVGNVEYRRIGAGHAFHDFCQLVDRDLLIGADIEYLSYGGIEVR